MSTHRWMIAFDISNDKNRRYVVKRLESQCERVARSVFEAVLSYWDAQQLQANLAELLDPLSDSIRMYPVCLCCSQRIMQLGCAGVTNAATYPIIL